MDRPKKEIVVFVLAAGKSSRMGMHTPKILLPVGGRPMIEYVLDVAQSISAHIYAVVSDSVQKHWNAEHRAKYNTVHCVLQEKPLGTGHAFALAFAAATAQDPDLKSKKIMVLLGDTPLITSKDISQWIQKSDGSDIFIIAMCPPCPDGYGRLFLENDRLVRIVETKDATESEKLLELCHSGVMCVRADFAEKALTRLTPSPVTGELYLTDMVQYAEKTGYHTAVWKNLQGINTREELIRAEAALQNRFREQALNQGAYLMSPETTFLSYDTCCAPDVIIHPMVNCGPGVILDEGVVVYSGSVLEHCHVKKSSRIGPFARLRPGTIVGPFGEIGNFVETKNAVIGSASQIKHLSYIGDAIIGNHVNIGAGVITCNYDGHIKQTTQLEDGVFVGSQTAFIAPIHVGKNSTIGAGSVITHSVAPETLALSRCEQRNIPLRPSSKHLKRIRKNRDI